MRNGIERAKNSKANMALLEKMVDKQLGL